MVKRGSIIEAVVVPVDGSPESNRLAGPLFQIRPALMRAPRLAA
jgi:hypothetical protein